MACRALPRPELIHEDDFRAEFRPVTVRGEALLDDWTALRAASRQLPTLWKAATHVWSVVDSPDGTLYAVAGQHSPRVGYVLTEKPWESRQDEAVWLSTARAAE